MEMLSYSHHDLVLVKRTYPENLVKIHHDDVILLCMASFSYTFLYLDVIYKNADISNKNDVITLGNTKN